MPRKLSVVSLVDLTISMTHIEAVRAGREAGLIGKENYWLFFNKKDGSSSVCRNEEYKKRDGYIGYFVEDDSRLDKIYECYLKKIRCRR